jgi:cytidylate kinase
MRVAICGKMCSGKTYIADKLSSEFNLEKFSFAGKVKEISDELFDITYKDRKLLQNIADKMKEIDKDVWAKYTMRQIGNKENVIIDDLRFQNELNYLKQNGFKIIKLLIDDDTQLLRLSEKYSKDFNNHVSRRNHNSEIDIDNLECDLDIISDENAYKNIVKFLHNT